MRIVRGSGPTDAAVMLIGERPGRQEDRTGRPFCGPAGQELDRYLAVNASLRREDIYVTNLVKTYDEEPPSPEEIERDWPLLMEELNKVRPQYVGFVGSHAARQFLVSDEWDMDAFHGLAWPPDAHRPYWSMGLWHPAAGLHQPSTAGRIAWDFDQLGRMVRGEEMPSGHLLPDSPGDYVEGGHPHFAVTAADTEGTAEKPWCLSYSQAEGTGVARRDGCGRLSENFLVLHHAIHDIPVLEAQGVRVGFFTDTMVMAALLGVEPHGLKALARRHCGMIMCEYADVVAPAARELALEYLGRVLDYADSLPKPVKPPKKKKAAKRRTAPPNGLGAESVAPASVPYGRGTFVATDDDIPF